MHWLDFLLLIVLGIGVVLGLRNGLIWQVAKVVIFFVAIYACINYHEVAAGWLDRTLTGLTPVITGLLAYVVTFLTVCVIGYIITYFIERAVQAANLKPLDRLLGGAVGLLKAGLVSGAILLGVALYSTPETKKVLGESRIAPVLLEGMRGVIVWVPQKYKDSLSDTLDNLRSDTPARGKSERIDPFTTPLD